MSELSHYIKVSSSPSGCNSHDAEQFKCDRYLDCESCLEDKIKEHDKQIRAEVINEYYNKINEKLKTDTNLKDTIRDIHNNVAQEMYCKGIDDLTERLKDYFVIPHDIRVIEMIAEQLKEQNK